MGIEIGYFWVVLCKNRSFHKRQNLFSGHSIPLADTDAIAPPPTINGTFRVRCNDCGQEYEYRAKDLLRAELEASQSFDAHPLFRENSSVIPIENGITPSDPAARQGIFGRLRTAVSPYFSRQKSGS